MSVGFRPLSPRAAVGAGSMALLHSLDRLVASRHERSRLDLSVFQTDRFTSGFHLILSISFVYRSINLRYPSTDLVTSTPPPTSSRNNYLPLDRRGIPYSLPTAKSNCHYLSVLIIELFFPYIISFFGCLSRLALLRLHFSLSPCFGFLPLV